MCPSLYARHVSDAEHSMVSQKKKKRHKTFLHRAYDLVQETDANNLWFVEGKSQGVENSVDWRKQASLMSEK